jgi:hypothetical protein
MKIPHLLVLCFSLVTGTALANPMRIVGGLSLESTGSTHVRIRFYVSYGLTTPAVATYGSSHSDWFTTGESYSTDTGSGVKSMTYYYMCDCHVSTGSALTYTAVAATEYLYSSYLTATITPSPSTTTLCDEKCAEADSHDAGVDTTPDGPLSHQPDATLAVDTGVVATGGSSATSTVGATGGSTASSSSASTAVGGNAGTSSVSSSTVEESQKSSGCSVASRGREGALSLLLALGLVALGLRRRQ